MLLSTISPAYFPDMEFFWKIAQSDVLVLTDHFQYTKRSSLTISAKLQTSQPRLRIPVRHTQQLCRIDEKLLVQNDSWPKKHLQTIRHMFHHAPYSYYYFPQLEELFNNKKNKLSGFLMEILVQLAGWLHLETKLYLASEHEPRGDNQALIEKWCKKFKCESYIQDDAVFRNNYVNEKHLNTRHIKTARFVPFPDYHILKSNRELCILHFLFHYGPEAGYMLRQYLPSGKSSGYI